VTEQQLLEHVLQAAADLGLLAYHHPDGRRLQGDAGFPDLVLLGPAGFLFAELKSGRGRLTLEQWKWRSAILAQLHGMHVIWQPSDWEHGVIQMQLKALAGL